MWRAMGGSLRLRGGEWENMGGGAEEGRAKEIERTEAGLRFVVPESTFSIVHVLSHVILPRSINI